MKKISYMLFILLFVAAPPGFGDPTGKHLVMVSIDGLSPDIYLNDRDLGIEVPNLKSIMRGGVYAEGMRGVVPTVTYPSHTTMVTGVLPATHGIIRNHKRDGTPYYYARDIRVATLWDVAREAGLNTALITWPATIGANVEWLIPENLSIRVDDLRELIRADATPGLFEQLEGDRGPVKLPSFDNPEAGEYLDRMTGGFAAQLLREQRPDLLFVHFLDADHWQHGKGPWTDGAMRAFERVDVQLGLLLKAARDAGIFEDTIFVVVGDHGFVQIHTGINVMGLLAEAGVLDVGNDGKLVTGDIEVQASGGSASVFISGDDGSENSVSEVESALETTVASRYRNLLRVATREELHARGGFPDADLALFAAPGFYFVASDSIQVAMPTLVFEGNIFQGSHGFDPDLPEMATGFMIRGPGIRKGLRIPLIRMLDVAPTLAGLLGLELDQAQGLELLGLRQPVVSQ